MITIPMTVAVSNVSVPMTAQASNMGLHMEMGVTCEMHNYPEYVGEYAFTPRAEEQIIPTEGFALLRNISIAPIPNNYGLITWNGSTLMVS